MLHANGLLGAKRLDRVQPCRAPCRIQPEYDTDQSAKPEGQSGHYRMAAGMDPNLAALVGSTMTGEPLDAAQEKAARDRGWR